MLDTLRGCLGCLRRPPWAAPRACCSCWSCSHCSTYPYTHICMHPQVRQEVFGLLDTPLLGGPARVPLLLELLSPAGRPLQVQGRRFGCFTAWVFVCALRGGALWLLATTGLNCFRGRLSTINQHPHTLSISQVTSILRTSGPTATLTCARTWQGATPSTCGLWTRAMQRRRGSPKRWEAFFPTKARAAHAARIAEPPF